MASMRRFAFVTASVIGGGCSIFTDLGGFDEAPTTIIAPPPDGSSSGDANAVVDAPVGASDATSDAGIDSAPIAARYGRALKVSTAATASSSTTACTTLGAEVIAVAVSAGKMRADLADLRVYGPSLAEVSRTVDPLPGGRAYLCFALQTPIAANGSASYEMRYGDANATPGPVNGVWPFVDDFDVLPAGPKWSVRGTPSVVNGRLKLPAGAVTSIVTAPGADGVPIDAELLLSVQLSNPTSVALTKDAGNAEDYFFWWFGFQRYGDFAEGEPWMVFIGRDVGNVKAENKQNGSGGGPCATTCADSNYGQTDKPRVYRIDRHANGVVFTYDDDKTFAPLGASGDMAILIRNSLAASDIFVDWVRARPIAWPEPTISVGDEKTF
jgi:hypothetical protein